MAGEVKLHYNSESCRQRDCHALRVQNYIAEALVALRIVVSILKKSS